MNLLKTDKQIVPYLDGMETLKSLTVYSYHVTYAFQSEATLYSCLDVKELLARSRREIWRLKDCNWTPPHNNLVHKRTLNQLAKLASLAKWLIVRLWTKWLWGRVHLLPIKISVPQNVIDFPLTGN